jgi:glycosyltransferase involved in cell wall biosynthesis
MSPDVPSLSVLRAVDSGGVSRDLDEFAAELLCVESDFVAIVSAGGLLRGDFASRVSEWMVRYVDLDVLYCDEIFVGVDGNPEPVLKPDFDAERLRCQFYFGSVVLYRMSLIRRLAGLRAEFRGAALYDLALRASRAARSIAHTTDQLFEGDAPVRLGAVEQCDLPLVRTVLEQHLAATGGGVVDEAHSDGVHDTHRIVVGQPLVSIIIPTRGLWSFDGGKRKSLIVEAVRSIEALSTYRAIEYVVVYDTVAESEILDALSAECGPRLRLVEWTDSFNFSGKINLGAVSSSGDYLLLLNDDVELITPGWIEAMLALAQLPGAGMSGCMLYYEDETIQHAGHGYWRGDATHIGMFEPRNSAGPLDGYRVERRVLGVTAACALMPRAVYFEVGGMTTLLPGNFNDVDLCMKVTTAGHQIYWTPRASLYHYESKTRIAAVRKYEVDVAWGRWGSRMHDPRFWPYAV